MSKPMPLPGKEAFCLNCHQFRPYYTELDPVSEMLPVSFTRAVKVVFPVVTAHCAKCGEEIYVSDIHDMNMDVRRTAQMKALYKEATKEAEE